jgi:probable H4MPT-linked C1 transfer pathway protein
MSSNIVGWDIGGVNTKAARLNSRTSAEISTLCVPYEIQRDPSALGSVIRWAARQLGTEPEDHHAITMTAELSQVFRTKREGVAFVLDAAESVLPPERLHVYTVAGEFVSGNTARERVLQVAASNWSATARWLAQRIPNCILIDIGSTTTDLIPVVDGRVAARGCNDAERLLSGELVYTGVLRTPVEAVARRVPLWGGLAAVSAEGFATMGDVHLWLGHLSSEDCTCPTPDGRPPDRQFSAERLARIVCADREMLDESAVQRMAATLAQAQVQQIVAALTGIRSRHPQLDLAATMGLGEFVAAEAARSAGLSAISVSSWLGRGAVTAPAVAVASLLAQRGAI